MGLTRLSVCVNRLSNSAFRKRMSVPQEFVKPRRTGPVSVFGVSARAARVRVELSVT